MTGDDLSFTAKVPKRTQNVRVRIYAKNIGANYAALSISGRSDSSILMNHPQLNDLQWPRAVDSGLTLWQRPSRPASHQTTPTRKQNNSPSKEEEVRIPVKHYDSLSELTYQTPDWRKIGVLGISPLALVRFSSDATQTPIRFSHSFRGSHTFYVYADPGQLTIAFEKLDLNRKPGRDPLTISVTRADRLRLPGQDPDFQQRIGDDGNITKQGGVGRVQPASVTVPVSSPGAYQVAIEASEDVLFRNLYSSSSYLSFSGSIFLADGPAYGVTDYSPISISSSTGALQVETAHEQGLQSISSSNRRYRLTKTKDTVRITDLGVNQLRIDRADIHVRNQEYLVLEPARAFPTYGGVFLPDEPTMNLEPYDYLVARYQPGQAIDMTVIDQSYPIESFVVRNRSLGFHLTSELLDEADVPIEIQRVVVEFRRGQLKIRSPYTWLRSLLSPSV